MQTTLLTPQELTKRLDLFEEACHARGLRITRQRREIFKTVAASRQHPSAETVFQAVRGHVKNVSLDTVYRTLASLEKMDLLIRVGTAGKERFDGDLRPHAHFVCTACGEVYDVFSNTPDLPQPTPEALACGHIKQINIQFRGICKRCAHP